MSDIKRFTLDFQRLMKQSIRLSKSPLIAQHHRKSVERVGSLRRTGGQRITSNFQGFPIKWLSLQDTLLISEHPGQVLQAFPNVAMTRGQPGAADLQRLSI